MTPPISIDGSTVEAITIDGTDVSEVTVDGELVFGNVIPDNPVARYKFEQNVTDSVGGNDGALLGSPSFVTDNRVGTYAMSLDGNDGVDINNSLNTFIDASAGSFGVWFKTGTDAPSVGEFREGDHIFADDSRFVGVAYADVGNGNEIGAYNFSGSYTYVSTSYTTGDWVHIGWAHGSGELAIFKNGSLADSGSSGDSGGLTNNITIGNQNGSRFVDGILDDAVFYDRRLTSSEWTTLYDFGSS